MHEQISIAGQNHPAGTYRIPPAISFVVPLFNEAENLCPLHTRITEVMNYAPEPYTRSYELILIDDGSNDESFQICAELQRQDRRVRVIQFRRRFGKTAALHAGFQLSQGERVITIDADMQEDPSDTFALLAKLDTGYDLVSAWRWQRNDTTNKTLPSRVFNIVVAGLTGVRLHDFNCGFKAYRREVVERLNLYGDQHRFIPVLAQHYGFRVGEVAVQHRARRFGSSKFGGRRFVQALIDLLQVLFLTSFLRRPLRLFGTIGLLIGGTGLLCLIYLTALWPGGMQPVSDRLALILGVLLLLSGLQFVSIGLIGEMLRQSSQRAGDDYSIRCVLGVTHDQAERARTVGDIR